MQIWKA